jgi:hypothetical protein
MPGLRTWKTSLPEDSPVLKDLLELGREMGMQPAETTRVILTEWSRALRGRSPFSGSFIPQMVAQAPTPPARDMPKKNERQQAKERGTRFAGTLDLDD